MPRAIAFSAKQKREQLQDKRAVKRGELDPSEVRYARNPLGNYRPGANHLPDPTVTSTSGSRLRSQFIALTPDYLNRARDLAHTISLPRPLDDEAAVFPVDWMERDEGQLTCPSRPAFKVGQTKEEVESNEEEMFAEWMRDTRGFVETWVEDEVESEDSADEIEGDEGAALSRDQLRSPTWFETNLEVWRQLWRVTETSHILLLLADARCPPLHLPTSLRSYVQALRPGKEVILVLTKSDLVEPDALEGWCKWVKTFWAQGVDFDNGGSDGDVQEVQVITVQSFKPEAETNGATDRKPDLSQLSHPQFLSALRIAHDRLRDRASPTSINAEGSLRPHSPMPSDVDWAGLVKGGATNYELNDAYQSAPMSDGREVEDRKEAPTRRAPLTIGLIGQPNVGKSSLLNAILGQTRVKASRTPGKTKHFQTMFWGEKKEVRFVDCPGLVCPSLVGLEIQALCGILPISQLPSLPACILSVARLLPLETIFNIPTPSNTTPKDPYADKRTWRGPRIQKQAEKESSPEAKGGWTAWSIIEGRALDRGYLTAKTGRPDINRAASGLMLALAEGKVKWCFRPPGSDTSDCRGRGIWLGELGSREASLSCSEDEKEHAAVEAIDGPFFTNLHLDRA